MARFLFLVWFRSEVIFPNLPPNLTMVLWLNIFPLDNWSEVIIKKLLIVGASQTSLIKINQKRVLLANHFCSFLSFRYIFCFFFAFLFSYFFLFVYGLFGLLQSLLILMINYYNYHSTKKDKDKFYVVFNIFIYKHISIYLAVIHNTNCHLCL